MYPPRSDPAIASNTVMIPPKPSPRPINSFAMTPTSIPNRINPTSESIQPDPPRGLAYSPPLKAVLVPSDGTFTHLVLHCIYALANALLLALLTRTAAPPDEEHRDATFATEGNFFLVSSCGPVSAAFTCVHRHRLKTHRQRLTPIVIARTDRRGPPSHFVVRRTGPTRYG